MNSFNLALKTEKKGEKRLLPILSREFIKIRKIKTKSEQMLCGDYEIDGCYHEFKFEERYTGNVFLETWSNKSKEILGWMFKPMKASYLWYGFLDKGVIYCFDFILLKEWFRENQFKYREIRQNKYVQNNDTYGRIVPLKDIVLFNIELEF